MKPGLWPHTEWTATDLYSPPDWSYNLQSLLASVWLMWLTSRKEGKEKCGEIALARDWKTCWAATTARQVIADFQTLLEPLWRVVWIGVVWHPRDWELVFCAQHNAPRAHWCWPATTTRLRSDPINAFQVSPQPTSSAKVHKKTFILQHKRCLNLLVFSQGIPCPERRHIN